MNAPAKKINPKISEKYNIGRYENVGHEVQDGNKRVFISNSSYDDYTNWLLALDFAKQYFDSDLYRFKVPLPVFEEEFEKAWEIYDHSADSKVDVDDFPTVLRIITDSFALKFKI